MSVGGSVGGIGLDWWFSLVEDGSGSCSMPVAAEVARPSQQLWQHLQVVAVAAVNEAVRQQVIRISGCPFEWLMVTLHRI